MVLSAVCWPLPAAAVDAMLTVEITANPAAGELERLEAADLYEARYKAGRECLRRSFGDEVQLEWSIRGASLLGVYATATPGVIERAWTRAAFVDLQGMRAGSGVLRTGVGKTGGLVSDLVQQGSAEAFVASGVLLPVSARVRLNQAVGSVLYRARAVLGPMYDEPTARIGSQCSEVSRTVYTSDGGAETALENSPFYAQDKTAGVLVRQHAVSLRNFNRMSRATYTLVPPSSLLQVFLNVGGGPSFSFPKTLSRPLNVRDFATPKPLEVAGAVAGFAALEVELSRRDSGWVFPRLLSASLGILVGGSPTRLTPPVEPTNTSLFLFSAVFVSASLKI